MLYFLSDRLSLLMILFLIQHCPICRHCGNRHTRLRRRMGHFGRKINFATGWQSTWRYRNPRAHYAWRKVNKYTNDFLKRRTLTIRAFVNLLINTSLQSTRRHIVCSESGNILIWNRLTEQVIYKQAQPGVVQLAFLEDGAKFFAISRPQSFGGEMPARVTATCITRHIPSK